MAEEIEPTPPINDISEYNSASVTMVAFSRGVPYILLAGSGSHWGDLGGLRSGREGDRNVCFTAAREACEETNYLASGRRHSKEIVSEFIRYLEEISEEEGVFRLFGIAPRKHPDRRMLHGIFVAPVQLHTFPARGNIWRLPEDISHSISRARTELHGIDHTMWRWFSYEEVESMMDLREEGLRPRGLKLTFPFIKSSIFAVSKILIGGPPRLPPPPDDESDHCYDEL